MTVTQPWNILIVEDEVIVARDVQNRLELLGCRVTGSASSGSLALAAAAKVRPDLVLMDIKLRGKMDGVQAAARFKTDLAIPVIFLSSHSDEKTIDRAKESEPYGYILKPIDTVDLRMAIEMAMFKHTAESRLRESEERWRFSLEGSNDGVWDWDLTSGSVYYSPRWLEIVGATAPAAGIEERSDRIHPEDKPSVDARMKLLQEGEMVQFSAEYRLRGADDTYRWIFERGKAVRHDTGGRAMRIIAVCSDFTQKREVEEQFRRQNEALVEANEMKMHLLSLASHDLKTPLSNILGVLGMYEKGQDFGEAVQYAKGLAERMLLLVKDLLDTAALHSGKLELHPTHVNLSMLVKEILSEYRPFAGQKNQTIVYVEELEQSPVVLADRMLLKLAIENILGNAVKYSEPGMPIAVGLNSRDDRAKISVKDEGPGLARDEKEKVFGYFQKLSPQPTAGEVSTGMGLYIVKQIMDLHDGVAGVDSEPGKGSLFFLELKISPVQGS